MEGTQPSETPAPEARLSEAMRSHIAAMRSASGDSLLAMVPAHRQMAANMLAQMNREMTEMNMPATPDWTATLDSLRHDLTQLPDMAPEEFRAFLPAHEIRLIRLAEMHRRMMSDMGM